MAGFQGRDYKIDIAFVIDATGSMEKFMRQFEKHALKLCDDIIKAHDYSGKHLESLRMRVIDFADFATEGDDALRQTEFFDMPAQKHEFVNAISKIDCEYRGGDLPENGLEALFAAMCSDWVKLTPSKDKGRHIIVLITDAYPLQLMERKGSVGYPEDEVPPDITALQNCWSEDGSVRGVATSLSKPNKRLILCAPDGDDGRGHSWSDVQSWENAVGISVAPGKGCSEVSFDSIIAEIVRSC